MSDDITVTILDLLNLSLGTPEIGAVNFNLLHRFLLELVKHFSLARKQIDITDDFSIQSALEETRVLSSTKSQPHFRTYSSFSEQADGKRLSELKAHDSFTALDHGKRGSIEIKSRGSVSGSDKRDAPASGERGKEGITNENRNGQVAEQGENRSKDENCGKQIAETTGNKENLQTKRSTGEMKSTVEAESRKNMSEEEGIKTADAKQRSSDDQSQFKTESPLSQRSSVGKNRTHSPPSGRSGSFGTKGSKRTSPSSSKTEVRKRSFMEIAVPGLTQMERKISILEAKFESLSAAPTNLDIVQQARDLQSRDSSTTAAGDMWQAMNLVRRIEVAEGAIDGITAMLDDISEQLRKIKENSTDDRLDEISNKLENVVETMEKLGRADLPAKFVEINGKLKNIVHRNDLKPFLTVKKMNDVMDFKLQHYRQVSPTTPKSAKKTSSTTKIAHLAAMESSSQPAHDQLNQRRPETTTSSGQEKVKIALTTTTEPGTPETTASSEQAETTRRSSEQAQPETTTTSSEQAQEETAASTTSDEPEQPGMETSQMSSEQAETDTTTNGEEAVYEATATTPNSEKAESEQYNDEVEYAESERAAYLADREEGERRGSVTTEAFEELNKTMNNWCDFREEASQKISNLEESLSNTVDNLNNLAFSQRQVKDELTLLKCRPLELETLVSVASQHDLSQLETSVEERLQALSKNLQEMKQNFFQMYEMKETIGSLKESDDHGKADIENIRREIIKIMKQLDDEQEARNAFANAVGRKHSLHNAGDSDELHRLRSSLSEMKHEIEKHNLAMSQVLDDQNKKQLHLEALYGHVDQLESAKADRQQINRDIEVKADRKDLEKKVSHDKFHNSLSCLDQSVQDLVEKLVGHEATLKQAVNHITLDVNSKLDKLDMDTVKDYFEGKLKDLNSKVQRKPSADKAQAAASRSMLLQPANCISCDRPVHLYREGAKLPSLPFNNPLPGTKSNRPYMTFDLSDVRKKMYDVQNPRGKDQTESLGQAKVQNELLKLGAIKEGDEFPEVTHRPCGGNHTLTCPEKRTTIRVNKAYREDLHFIAQLSQKDLSIVDILGYDGHVYKGHVNQLPSIPEIPKNTMTRRPNSGSGRPRTSSPI